MIPHFSENKSNFSEDDTHVFDQLLATEKKAN